MTGPCSSAAPAGAAAAAHPCKLPSQKISCPPSPLAMLIKTPTVLGTHKRMGSDLAKTTSGLFSVYSVYINFSFETPHTRTTLG